MAKFLVPLIFILIDWYFFTGVQTIIKDFSPQRKNTIQIIYWTISALTFLLLFISFGVNQKLLPGFFRSFVVSLLFIIIISKLLGSIFLLIDDILRLFRLGYQYITTFN